MSHYAVLFSRILAINSICNGATNPPLGEVPTFTVAVVVVVEAIDIFNPAYGSVDLGYACSVELPSWVQVNIIESVAIPTVEYARLIPLVVALTNV